MSQDIAIIALDRAIKDDPDMVLDIAEQIARSRQKENAAAAFRILERRIGAELHYRSLKFSITSRP